MVAHWAQRLSFWYEFKLGLGGYQVEFCFYSSSLDLGSIYPACHPLSSQLI